jgi:hypothetical protein
MAENNNGVKHSSQRNRGITTQLSPDQASKLFQDNGVTREETKSEAIKNFPITNAHDPDSMRKTG